MRVLPLDPTDAIVEHFAQPTIPQALTRLSLDNEEHLSSSDLCALLDSDPELHARVFQLARSEYHSGPKSLKTTRELVCHFGPSGTRRLIWVATMMITLGPDEQIPFRRFWRHAYRTHSIVLALVEQFCQSVDPGPLQLPALLHDVGKLVYRKFYPQEWSRVEAFCRVERCTTSVAERYFQLPSHAEFGACLADSLSMPDAVRHVCRHHELGDLERWNNRDGNPSDALLLVTLANLIEHLSAMELSPESLLRCRGAVRKTLALNETELDGLLESVACDDQRVESLILGLARAA